MANYEQSIAELKDALQNHFPCEGLEYDGIATHIVDMNSFYIVPLSVYRLMSILEKPGNHCAVPDLCDVVIYLSPTLGHHARGVVQEVCPDGSCAIFAMDYGITEAEIASANIFTPFYIDAVHLLGFAQHCELSMCFPRESEFSQENIDDFKFFMGEEREKLAVTIKEANAHKMGVLIMSSRTNPDDVSMVMGYTNNSVLFPSPLQIPQL